MFASLGRQRRVWEARPHDRVRHARLYAVMYTCVLDLIEEAKPGSCRSILPADLPTDTVSGGGSAPAHKYGDRWEHVLDHKAWMRVHDKPRTALFTPTGTEGGPGLTS